MIQSIPTPPTPPLPPEVVVGPPALMFPAAAIMVLAIVAGFVLWPMARAWARRIEGKTVDQALLNELDQLRNRVAELEESNHRLLELEERVDFSERLLSQGREGAAAPRKEKA